MLQHIAIVLEDLFAFAKIIAENWNPSDENILSYNRNTAWHYQDIENKIMLLFYYLDGNPTRTIEMVPSDYETVGLYGLQPCRISAEKELAQP